MYAQPNQSVSRRYRNGYYVLLIIVFLNSLVFVGTILPVAHAASGGDLLGNIPVVDEKTLNNAACGVAAATMVLDYYLPQSGPIHQALDIPAVAQYVKENYRIDAITGRKIPVGTGTDQLQTGIEAVSTAPQMQFGVPVIASWHTTDDANWFSLLKSELDAKRPVVLYLADGGTLGWSWHYGHYIVVSGYTSDDSIIYHDPWDGKPHTLSNAAFAAAWGTTWSNNPPWWYMQIMPSTKVAPTTVPMPPTPQGNMAGFSQFVGTWISPTTQMIIASNGLATYTGWAWVQCSDDPRPPCDKGNIGGMHTTIRFVSVDGNMALGVIIAGTGFRRGSAGGTIVTAGGNLSVWLDRKHGTLDTDDADVLCPASTWGKSCE